MFKHNPAHSIRKDRVKLIRAMESAANSTSSLWTYHPRNLEIKLIIDSVKNHPFHFLSISQDEWVYFVSYARRAEDKYNNKRRFKTTLGRYISRNAKYNRHVLNKPVVDAYIEMVIAMLCVDSITITPLKGEQITQYYNNSPSSSCMTGVNSDKTELYAINDEKVSLFVYDEIRALAWVCDDGTKVLDRAYPAGHHKISILREWAKRNGYVLRNEPDRVVHDNYVALTDDKIHNITVRRPKKAFPYADTFSVCKIDCDDDKIVISNGGDVKYGTLRRTDGFGPSDPRFDKCGRCNSFVSKKFINNDFICNDCENVHVKICSSCNCKVDTYFQSSFCEYLGKIYCMECSEKRFTRCNCCGVYVANEKAVRDVERIFMLCNCNVFSDRRANVGEIWRNTSSNEIFFITHFDTYQRSWRAKNQFGADFSISNYEISYGFERVEAKSSKEYVGDIVIDGNLVRRFKPKDLHLTESSQLWYLQEL